MDEFERVIGQTMRVARSERGLTQPELAGRLGVDWGLVSKVESGQRPLEVGEFFDWVQALDMDGVALFEQICNNAAASRPE